MYGKRRGLFYLFVLCLVFAAFLFVLLQKNYAAQAADTILRPIIGEKNTLALESVYFNALDQAERLHFALAGSKSQFTIQRSSKKVHYANVDKLDLDTLPAVSTLPTLPGEGLWTPIEQDLYPNQVVIARTFMKPDPTHPYALAYIVKMDMKKLGLGTQAGTYYPGGVYKVYGPGFVPRKIQQKNLLLAVFNGGFQAKDGHYGMIVGSKTYVPLKLNMPALIMYTDGSFRLTTYTGQKFSGDIASIRQNGSFLIQNGKITSYTEQGPDTWGRTITNSMYTWRSGLGVTKEGNLIYVVGNSLVPQTLAQALLAAGAVKAIQLDINPPWVKFIVYHSLGNGTYSSVPLLTSMTGGKQYLTRYNKDFFYIYKR